MSEKIGVRLSLVLGMVLGMLSVTYAQQSEYVVLVGKSVRQDKAWDKVIDKVVEIHQAAIVEYQALPSEALPWLKELYPRYVAIVEKPENVSLDFVVDINRMSREVDDDIYNDFLWGIITGYDADAALRLVERAQVAKLVRSAWCIGGSDFEDGKYFEQMGRMSESTKEWSWGEKESISDSVIFSHFNIKDSPVLIEKMLNWAVKHNPDLVVYQTPDVGNRIWLARTFFVGEQGFLSPREGKLWYGDKEVKLGDHSRVCIVPAFGGNTFGTRESVPVAWLDAGNTTALLGLMTISSGGRGEWGTLKYWLTDAGRFTLAEASFLNQQEMLYRLNRWSPELLKRVSYGEVKSSKAVLEYFDMYKAYQNKIVELTGSSWDVMNKFEYMYEKDILVYYGDPAWNVRMKDLSEDRPYHVTFKMKRKKCIVTIKTSSNFTLEKVGGKIRREKRGGVDGHAAIGDLPICYFFPKRLKNPHVSEKLKDEYEIEVNKDCLFIYNNVLEAGKEYRIVIDVSR